MPPLNGAWTSKDSKLLLRRIQFTFCLLEAQIKSLSSHPFLSSLPLKCTELPLGSPSFLWVESRGGLTSVSATDEVCPPQIVHIVHQRPHPTHWQSSSGMLLTCERRCACSSSLDSSPCSCDQSCHSVKWSVIICQWLLNKPSATNYWKHDLGS
jgi:hypothetical protein